MTRPLKISLRPTEPGDVRTLFEHQSDPHANALAGTRPRNWPAFEGVWAKIFEDTRGATPGVRPRVILADGELVGGISVFAQGDKNSLGYWIARPHWGRGIATTAIGLILHEVRTRPLHAQVAVHNIASLRALARHGFLEVSRVHEEGTERYLPGEVVSLVLA